METEALVLKPLILLDSCLLSQCVSVSGCRAELHEVLEEYKEGAAKFIGKGVCVFVCMS